MYDSKKMLFIFCFGLIGCSYNEGQKDLKELKKCYPSPKILAMENAISQLDKAMNEHYRGITTTQSYTLWAEHQVEFPLVNILDSVVFTKIFEDFRRHGIIEDMAKIDTLMNGADSLFIARINCSGLYSQCVFNAGNVWGLTDWELNCQIGEYPTVLRIISQLGQQKYWYKDDYFMFTVKLGILINCILYPKDWPPTG